MRMHFWSIHRDSRNFSYPDAFYPDRWLIVEGVQESKEKLVHDMNAYIPFSFGPRNCVGKNLALLEMRMLLCYFVQKLEVRFAEGYDRRHWLDELDDAFVTSMGKLPVVLHRRD